VLVEEIGGVYEESAAPIKKLRKPVVCMIGGIFAPPGKQMGHAGAIVEGNIGTAQTELKASTDAGAYHAKTFINIPEILQSLGV
jgi:succinyl-CoA synthetase alpha subunit